MITSNNEIHGIRIAEKAGLPYYSPQDPCISRTDRGELLGGVVFTNYTGVGGSVTIHVASWHPRWISRDMLWVTFDYPFNQLKVKKLFGQVPSTNTKALEFDLNLGFKLEQVIKDVYSDGDMLLLSMYHDECRFLKIVPRNPLR